MLLVSFKHLKVHPRDLLINNKTIKFTKSTILLKTLRYNIIRFFNLLIRFILKKRSHSSSNINDIPILNIFSNLSEPIILRCPLKVSYLVFKNFLLIKRSKS